MSTILSQYVFPTRSLESTTAPCNPVYVHFDLFGYATYSRATATAWILLLCLGTKRLTVSLSASLRMDGIVVSQAGLEGGTVRLAGRSSRRMERGGDWARFGVFLPAACSRWPLS